MQRISFFKKNIKKKTFESKLESAFKALTLTDKCMRLLENLYHKDDQIVQNCSVLSAVEGGSALLSLAGSNLRKFFMGLALATLLLGIYSAATPQYRKLSELLSPAEKKELQDWSSVILTRERNKLDSNSPFLLQQRHHKKLFALNSRNYDDLTLLKTIKLCAHIREELLSVIEYYKDNIDFSSPEMRKKSYLSR